jgi:hypothetical protein
MPPSQKQTPAQVDIPGGRLCSILGCQYVELSRQSYLARIELYHNLSNGAKLHCRGLACMNWKDLQRISEPRRPDLHVIPQHQFLGIRMELDLLVSPLGHRVAVQMMLEERQRHDQRQQSLPAVLDETQALLLIFAGEVILEKTHRRKERGTPQVLDAQRLTCLPRVPITARPSMSMAPYSAVSSSQSRLPASATRRSISVVVA